VYWLYPETAFRSLEEVDVIFALADEEPGNPWLNAVKFSKNEPLWFGKRGEQRAQFQYQNSSWHHRFLNSSGSSGNGTGSDSNRPMIEKDQAAEEFNKSLQPPEAALGSVNTNCYAGQNSYRPTSPESPIDPRLCPPSPSRDTSPTSTMANQKLHKSSRTHHKDSLSSEPTLIHHEFQDSADPPAIHRNKSLRDTWYHSKESLASPEGTRHHNPESQPRLPVTSQTRSRSNSSSPPSPGFRAVSRGRQPRQARSRPTTADTYHSYFDDQESDHHAITADERIETESIASFSYPGRLDSDAQRGIGRTASGRETYLPDGLAEESGVERRLSNRSENQRRFAARDAGRAF
jgi:hypothetical protein